MSEDRMDRLRKMRQDRPIDANGTKLAVKPYLQSVALDPRAPVDVNQYPYNIPAIRELGQLALHPDITFLVGENGAGKSTLLEGIALALGFRTYLSSPESLLGRLTNDGCVARRSMDHHASSSRLALARHASPSASSYLLR
jgi:predicted ATPase